MDTQDLEYWIKKITTRFYEIVYEDVWFKKIFRNIDQKVITSQQIDFMVQNFGGPKMFSGRSPKDAHPHIWIDENIWIYREALLKQTFDELAAPKEISEKWLRIDEAFKQQVIKNGGPEVLKGRYKTEELIYEPMPDHLKKAS